MQETSRITFAPRSAFFDELKRRVDAEMANAGKSTKADWRMYLKTATILVWFFTSYLLLMFVAQDLWAAIPLSISLGMAMAGIGFSVMHDGNHGAVSESNRVNRFFGLMLDMLGGSSYYWRVKHNILHHTYPNIDGADDDIDVGGLARLAPQQERRGFHRFQATYIWVLYGLLAIKWHFVDDLRTLANGRIGNHRIPKLSKWDTFVIVFGKIQFYVWSMVLPLLLHPPLAVFVCYMTTTMVLGFMLAVVFQLAHCVEEAEFPEPDEASGRMEVDWAVHQLETTVDFGRNNRLLTWYVGGLNFQVEHHLFPKICHVHYPRIAPIVEQTCKELGVPYRTSGPLLKALGSHWRFLDTMAKQPAPATAAAPLV